MSMNDRCNNKLLFFGRAPRLRLGSGCYGLRFASAVGAYNYKPLRLNTLRIPHAGRQKPQRAQRKKPQMTPMTQRMQKTQRTQRNTEEI